MKVIKLFATLRKIADAKTLAVPLPQGATVAELIELIGESCPPLYAALVDEDHNLSPTIQVLIDGRNIMWLNGMDTVITESAEVALIPQVAGG